MESKELKTSVGQRIFISLIAVLMLGSMVASYALIIANGNKDASSASETQVDETKVAELEAKYAEVEAKFKVATKGDFETFVAFKGEVKAFNETAANSSGISKRDLKVGSGRELGEGDSEYYAYYIGWCADETVFDSTFDDVKNPTGFKAALNASIGLIEGWNVGVVGMKIGGVREITIPGELAYGNSIEICGGYNKPLKFIIMAKEKSGDFANIVKELEEASLRLQYAQYGLDYDNI